MPRTKSLPSNRRRPVEPEPWFESFRDEVGVRAVVDSSWPPTATAMLREAVSDAGAEQFLNPLAAMRLRQFGRRRASGQGFRDEEFWARSEWEKVVRTALLGTGA